MKPKIDKRYAVMTKRGKLYDIFETKFEALQEVDRWSDLSYNIEIVSVVRDGGKLAKGGRG